MRLATGNKINGDLDALPAPPRIDIPAADLLLLERAACTIGAVGVEVVDGEGYVKLHFANESIMHSWKPLIFSGDALDLAVPRRLEIDIHEHAMLAMTAHLESASEQHGQDTGTATRRAIIRSVGEI